MSRLYFSMEKFDINEDERYLNKLDDSSRKNSIYATNLSELKNKINTLPFDFKRKLTHVYIEAHGSPTDPAYIYADGECNASYGIINIRDLAALMAPIVNENTNSLKFIFHVCFSADKINFGHYYTFNPNTVIISRKGSLIDLFRQELNKYTKKDYVLKGYSGQASRYSPQDKFTSVGKPNARNLYLDKLKKLETSSTNKFYLNSKQFFYLDEIYCDLARHFGASDDFIKAYKDELIKISTIYNYEEPIKTSVIEIYVDVIKERLSVDDFRKKLLASKASYDELSVCNNTVTSSRLRYAIFYEGKIISHSFKMDRNGVVTEKTG